MSKSINKELVIIIILVISILVPFSNRAFFVDDYHHFLIAKQISIHPLKPYDFVGFDCGREIKGWDAERNKLPGELNPPLMQYFLALFIKLFSEEIWKLRIAFIIFPLLSGIFMYFVSKRFTSYPLLSTSLLIINPAFWVTSVDFRSDSVLLTFYLCTLLTFFLGYEKQNWKWLITSGLLTGFAILTKYMGFTLILILFFWVLLNEKGSHKWRKFLLVVIISGIIFGIWSIFTFYTYGSVHFFSSLKAVKTINISSVKLWVKILSALIFFSGSLIFTNFSFYLIIKKKRNLLVSVFALAGTILFLFFSSPAGGFEFRQSLLMTIFIVGTIIFLYLIFDGFKKITPKQIFLIIWLLGTFSITIATVFWISQRYLLILIPPAAILFVQLLEECCGDKKSFKVVQYFVLILTFIVGLSVTCADYIQAEVFRHLRNDLVKQNLVGYTTRNRNLYFYGSSLIGMFPYLVQIGWKPFSNTTEFENNDLLLFPHGNMVPLVKNLLPKTKMNLYETFEYRTSFPLRVMSNMDSAGLYCSFFGSLPFSFATNSLIERFYVVEKK